MEPKEDVIVKKMPWLGIIAIVYGLLAFLIVGFIAHMHRYWGTDEKVLPHAIIPVLIGILVSHFSLFKILTKPEQYKCKAVTYLGVVVSYIVLIKSALGIVIMPSIYEHQLKSDIAETSLIKVSAIRIDGVRQFEGTVDFEIRDKERIHKFIENIEVAPFGYGSFCECMGEQDIEFYQNEKISVILTFHHGNRLRWEKSMANGDLELTNKSSIFFKNLLNEQGNYEYEIKNRKGF